MEYEIDKRLPEEMNVLSGRVIEAAIAVHKALGPGLLENVYEACLAYELANRKIPFEVQKAIPVTYNDVKLDVGFRVDILVGGVLVVELKAVDGFNPVHMAQVITYLKLTGCPLGLLINFNVPLLKQGVKRVVLTDEGSGEEVDR